MTFDMLATAPVNGGSSGLSPVIVLAIGFVIGLIVGWNFLPQPAWIARIFKRGK